MGLYEEQKKVYDVEYKKMKEEGYPFHPFATWKDMVVALLVLLVLLALTFTRGVHLDAPADPTAIYLPRPEWYFMFLFELLKYFPGPWAIIPVAILPGVAGAALMLLPFYDRNPYRSPSKRPVATAIMTISMLALVGLTVKAYWDDAQHAKANAHAVGTGTTAGGHAATPVAAGGEEGDGAALFAANCAMCHGAEGNQMPNAPLFTTAFQTGKDLKGIVTNGSPAKGMPAFGQKLKEEEIDSIVGFLKSKAH